MSDGIYGSSITEPKDYKMEKLDLPFNERYKRERLRAYLKYVHMWTHFAIIK